MQSYAVEPSDAFFEALMAAYTDAWNREDIDAIERHYNIPFFRYADGALQVYLDPESSRKARMDWIEVNRREGPALWERLSSTVTRLGRNSATVTTRWTFRRPDGTSVWDFVDTMNVCRFGESWRFVARTLHD